MLTIPVLFGVMANQPAVYQRLILAGVDAQTASVQATVARSKKLEEWAKQRDREIAETLRRGQELRKLMEEYRQRQKQQQPDS